MSNDPRKRKVTITMTAEEWDALAFFKDPEQQRMSSYVVGSEVNSRARFKIGEAVGSPAERYSLALTEVQALRPVILDNSATNAINEAIRAYVAWFQAGDFEGVSHLGAGNPTDERYEQPVDGLRLHMMPNGTLVFQLRELAFGGHYPYFKFSQGEADLLVKLCTEAGPVLNFWNGAGASSLSVRFRQPAQAPAQADG